ncbi:MAG: hypothetical protein GF410_01260 [Chitinivibrionales bacterium]|nr:hypothetical protein [Chitinivibrionales bacterium]
MDWRKALIYRWEALLAICVLAAIAVIAGAGYPLALREWREISRLRRDLGVIQSADALEGRIKAARARALRLDSMAAAYDRRAMHNEAGMVGALYALADSAGCSAAKVEICEPVGAGKATEVPVLFTGQGTYASIGKMVAGVESMPQATRVRQLVIRKSDGGKQGRNGLADVVLDFVIVKAAE